MKTMPALIIWALVFTGIAVGEEPVSFEIETWVLGFDRTVGPIALVGQNAPQGQISGDKSLPSLMKAVTEGSPLLVSGIGLAFFSTPEGIRWTASADGHGNTKTFDELEGADLKGCSFVFKKQLWAVTTENQLVSMRILQESGQYFEPASDTDETLFNLVNMMESPGMELRMFAEDIGEEICQLHTQVALTELVEREKMDGVALDVGKPCVRKTELPDAGDFGKSALRYGSLLATYFETAATNSYLLLTRVQKPSGPGQHTVSPYRGQASFSMPVIVIKGDKNDPHSFRRAFLDAIVPASDITVNQTGVVPFRTMKWDALARWTPQDISAATEPERLRQILCGSTCCELISSPRLTTGTRPISELDGSIVKVVSSKPDPFPADTGEKAAEQRDAIREYAPLTIDGILEQLSKGKNRAKSDVMKPGILTDVSIFKYEQDGVEYHANVGLVFGVMARWPKSGGPLPVRYLFRNFTRNESAFDESTLIKGMKHLKNSAGEPVNTQAIDADFTLAENAFAAFAMDAADMDATLLAIVTVKTPDANGQWNFKSGEW